jgi:catechol 2,3-dioxygenase-like lactoylglutathione lyase family enzyme
MRPETLDHVALWVGDRDALADFLVDRLGMHVIERTDNFTLVGADARRGKLTLFAAEGDREPGVLARIGLRVFDLE